MNINSEYTIRQEVPADFSIVENLTREAFWNVYHPGCSEHYVLHCFRDRPDFIPELSLVVERECCGCQREIVAHVMFAWSEILLDGDCPRALAAERNGLANRRLKMMTFGPISVRPDLQRRGIGKMLLDFAMERAREMGGGCIAMCGNIRFYGKCGFEVATTKGVRYADDPDGDAPYFLIRELTPGFLDGVRGTYKDPEGYFVSETETEEFDKRFPLKEKKVLPGQLTH
ncbi:MAG: N-acetyltransferase [Fibrobacter sp.]|nr:N-acetyltransferase [Fibrobacter sp.]